MPLQGLQLNKNKQTLPGPEELNKKLDFPALRLIALIDVLKKKVENGGWRWPVAFLSRNSLAPQTAPGPPMLRCALPLGSKEHPLVLSFSTSTSLFPSAGESNSRRQFSPLACLLTRTFPRNMKTRVA